MYKNECRQPSAQVHGPTAEIYIYTYCTSTHVDMIMDMIFHISTSMSLSKA